MTAAATTEIRVCARDGCDAEVTHPRARYHDRSCQNQDYQDRRREKEKRRRAENALTQRASSAYTGETFDVLKASGIGAQAVDEDRSMAWVGRQLETLLGRRPANSTISASMRAIRTWLESEEAQNEWSRDWDTTRQLMLHRELPDRHDEEAVKAWVTEAVDAFISFEARFWSLSDGTKFIRKLFHRRWLIALLTAFLTGAQQLILSPPRHGKTELLQHLCVWLIARNPNIRIIWVGVSGDIAKESTGAIREMLEDDTLNLAVNGPARSFKPTARIGSKWRDDKLTVERSAVGQKGATLTAQGRGAKLLSKDADLIVGDDLEDFDSTEHHYMREGTRRWFATQLDSRKDYFCAWWMIGSRQHPDDLWNYLIDDPTWATIVESAHDKSCVIPEDEIAAHVDCMLFPERNPYAWLYAKRISFRSMGQEHLWEMVYMNDPTPEGLVTWTRDEAKTSYDWGRGLGLGGLEGRDIHLIGGLDPSATGYQAAFCWAVELFASDAEKGTDASYIEHMVDLDNHLGGGVDAFIDGPGQTWLDSYGLRHWVVEDNLFKQVFSHHPRLLTWASEHNITIEPIPTSGNTKWDPLYGVKAMHRLWTDPNPHNDATTGGALVTLPYGDPIARAKTEIYVTQLLRFTEDVIKLKKRRTDVLMSSWLPQRTILGWVEELVWADQVEEILTESSYASYDVSEYNEAPW